MIPLLYLFSQNHSQLLLPLVEFINRGAAETDIEWGIQGFENEFHKLCGGKLVFMRETGKGRKAYLKRFAIAKSRVSNKLPKFLAGIDGPVVFGWDARAEGLREEAVVPKWNLVVCCVFAVDEALDGVTAIVENEPAPQCQRNNVK